jgi:hypothetical protein
MTRTYPHCDRTFRRRNQRHARGTGYRDALLANRPQALVDLYGELKATVKGFGSRAQATGLQQKTTRKSQRHSLQHTRATPWSKVPQPR